MPTTPDEYLPILTKALDGRFPRIVRLRDYSSGRAPLPEMGENLRASWEAFQRKACTDLGGLAINSLANRIVPNSIRIGGTDDSDAVRAARRIWRDNRMDSVIADAVHDYLAVSVGYLVIGSGSDGTAVVTREIPEQFIALTDPARPWIVVAALKVWRDALGGVDYAYVWVRGQGQLYERPSRLDNKQIIVRAFGAWVRNAPPDMFEGRPPVVVLDRREGFIEPHTGVIDRINLGKLHRLVITAMQAFRQRALKVKDGMGGRPAGEDDDENAVDLAVVFEPAPGALWELPEGWEVWESEQTDIRPLLEGEKSDARDFSAVTQTPISVFIPAGENQSAEGAAQASAGQVFQANNEITRIKPSIAVALVYALRVEGVDLGEDTVEIGFVPADRISVSEKYNAAAQAKNAGESWKSIARNILGYTPDQIAQDAADRAEEMLQQFMLTGASNAPTNP